MEIASRWDGVVAVGCDDSLECGGAAPANAKPGKCQRPNPLGHACGTATTYTRCVAGAECIGNVCIPKRVAHLGEPCQNVPDRCASGLHCVFPSGTCEVDPNPMVSFSKDWQNCVRR
jgi:hypothetical protein